MSICLFLGSEVSDMKYKLGQVVILNNNKTVMIISYNSENKKYFRCDTNDNSNNPDSFEFSKHDVLMTV